MEISVACTHCGQTFTTDESLASQAVVCPACQQSVEVPRRKIRLRQTAGASPSPTSARPCSHCGASLSADAMICVACGWDLRTNRPLQTSVRQTDKPNWRRRLLVIVSLVVITGSLWQIWSHFRFRLAPAQRPPSAVTKLASKVAETTQKFSGTEPEEPGGEILRWEISATTELCSTNAVIWGGIRTPQPASRAVTPLQPAIRVTVETTLAQPELTLWPRTTRVQFLRSSRPEDPGQVLVEVRGEDLFALRTQGTERGRQGLQFYFRDLAPERWRPQFYRVRFLGQHGKELATSGPCSATIIHLPAWELTDADSGQPTIRWKDLQPPPPADSFLFVELAGLHDLGRWPVRAGEFRSPVPAIENGRPTPLAFGIAVPVVTTVWASDAGARTRNEVARFSERMPVQLAPLKMGQGPPPHPETLQWVITPETGVVTLQNNLHDIRAVTASETVTPSGGRQTSGWATIGFSAAPGRSEPYAITYVWQEMVSESQPIPNGVRTVRKPGDILTTTQVSVVRSPLPVRLRAVAGNGEVRLTWEPPIYRAEDWVGQPQIILLRAEEREVTRAGGQLAVRPQTQIFRTPASTTEFIDRQVTNGAVYFYTVAIEGATRARSWWRGVGNYDCILPVNVRLDTTTKLPPVFAIPNPPGPVTLTLAAAPAEARVLPPLIAAVTDRAAGSGWLQLLLADDGEPLLPAPASSLAPLASRIELAAKADGQLQLTLRKLRDSIYLDVWLDLPGSGLRERLLTLPMSNAKPDTIATSLLERLTEKFRESARAGSPPLPAEQRRVAAGRLAAAAAATTPANAPAGPAAPAPWDQARALEQQGDLGKAAVAYAKIPHSFPALLAATRLLPGLPPADRVPVLRGLWENHRDSYCNRDEIASALQAEAPEGTNGLRATAVPSPDEQLQQSLNATPFLRDNLRPKPGGDKSAAHVERTTSKAVLRFAEEGTVTVVDPDTKETRWQYALQPKTPYKRDATTLMAWRGAGVTHFVQDLEVFANSFLQTDETLYLTDIRGGRLHALDAGSGEKRWVYTDWGMISAPLIVAGRLFVGNVFGDLVELDSATGAVRQRFVHPVELESFVKRPSLPLIFPVEAGQSLAFADLSPSAPPHMPGSWPVTHTVRLADGQTTFTVRKPEPTPPPQLPAAVATTAPLPNLRPPKFSDEGYRELIRNIYSFELRRAPLHPEEHRIVADVRDTYLRCQQGDAEAQQRWRDMLQMTNNKSVMDTALAAGVVARWYSEPEFAPLLMPQAGGGTRPSLLYSVTEALGTLGDPQAIPALIRALPEFGGDLYATYLVLPHLERLSGRSFGPYQWLWWGWWNTAGRAELP